MQKQYRYYWVDIAKVVSMFGVIFIHSSSSESLASASHYFRFCVPIFIATSFFLIERSQIDKQTTTSASSLWKRRLPRLLIPFFIWSFIYTVIYLQPQYLSSLKFITRHWIGFGWSGQYYLLVMVQLVLLYPWLRKIKIAPKHLLILGILNILALYLPLSYFPTSNIRFFFKLGAIPFIYWVFYVLLAIYVARNYDLIRAKLRLPNGCTESNRIAQLNPTLMIFTAPLLIVFEVTVLRTFQVNIQGYFCLSVLLVSCFLFFAFIQLEIVLEHNLPRQWSNYRERVSWLASWTLGIFCLNPLIIHVLKVVHILNFDPPPGTEIVVHIFNTGVVYGIAVLLSCLINVLGGKSLVK